MGFVQLVKRVDTSNCYKKIINPIELKAQYNPERFHLWKFLHVGPEEEVLNMMYSPHYRFLKDRNNDSYYRLQRKFGRNNLWIKNKTIKFLNIFESIKKEGFTERLMIMETPIVKNKHNIGFEIFEGHHRVSCALILNIKKIPCLVIRR